MQDLNKRFKDFAISVGTMIQKLPTNTINVAYSRQLIRCSSSPGANYRAAKRAKSNADFINKLKIVEEELDESIYFIELIEYFNKEIPFDFKSLEQEANELLAMIVKSIKTARKQ